VASDVFVALDVARERVQHVYKVWEVGGPPTCVIEVTSPSTANED